ncbi:MAG: hypothetical protein JW940_09745 [Polyangiaceae bacterium]|nr:hypothetical protein [Polyangiaceae bacterium]
MTTVRVSVFCILALAFSSTLGLSRDARHCASDGIARAMALPRAVEPTAADACETRRRALLSQSGLPAVPVLESNRYEILARARAEPVVFLTPPTEEALPSRLARLRERLHAAQRPWQALHDAFSQLKGHPRQLRQVVLTDGYLYAETPNLAALLSKISLARLFSEAELDVTRGPDTRRAVRKAKSYVWADGPEAGRPATLWLFDRVAVHGEQLSSPKHVSVSDLHRQTSANRIEIERLSNDGALATLVYRDQRVPAVLSVEEGRLVLDCEVVRPEAVPAVAAARRLNQRRERVIDRLRVAVSEQVDEGLPFDEPRTEEGQQDGQLRLHWRIAYASGQQTFEFNGDEYSVFGPNGIPRTPQVCVDFITDTWERMAGTGWAPSGEGRVRHIGRLDVDALGVENRRRVASLVDFAAAHPEWFETKVIPEPARVKFASRADFFRRLFEQRSDFQPGDVVAILGPRNDDTLHYHSFFIFAANPVTGMPTLVAANAGRPRIRTWESEMQNAPLRSIVARIRPKLEWLEAIAGTEEQTPTIPVRS